MILPIYMDNQATTRLDPRVLSAMLPFFTEQYGNSGSTTHAFGWEAKAAVDAARESIAAAINAWPSEIVCTSGATESNNLAIRGVAERTRRRGNHIVSVTTEHKAVLDPLKHLARRGYEITLLPVQQSHNAISGELNPRAGMLDSQQVADAIRDDTLLVSVMLANNEIGAIQPIAQIGRICRERGVPLHCDATQVVGKLPVDVDVLQIDLMSFTAHKIYGPKGIGALYVRRNPRLRLESQIDGGGQENGLRSGTLNVPGIVGFATALDLCKIEMAAEPVGEPARLTALRNRLFEGLSQSLSDVWLNGPAFESAISGMSAIDPAATRLPGNLNMAFGYVQGEALLLEMKNLSVSSGAACTSANPEPSHVLRALGLDEDRTKSSLRFSLGRFNTAEEVEYTIAAVTDAVLRLRKLSSLA